MSLPLNVIRRVALVSSVIFRLLSYIFLRWLFYDQYAAFLLPFAVYAAAWFLFDGVLCNRGASSHRMMIQQQNVANGGTSCAIAEAATHGTLAAREIPLTNRSTIVTPPWSSDIPSTNMPTRWNLTGILFGGLTSSRAMNRANLVFNGFILLMTIDNLFGLHANPAYLATNLSYYRVGAIGHSWAKISARVIDPEGARLIFRLTQPLSAWTVGPLLAATNQTDYMITATIDHLQASSQYEVRIGRHNEPMHIHPSFPSSQRFTTFPDPKLATSSYFSFAATSCIKSGFPYVPLKSKLSLNGAEHLADAVHERGLQFVLFLGDFICIRLVCTYHFALTSFADSDRPWWPGPALRSYHKRYRQVYASPQWRRVIEKVPTLHIYDDHEIINDFDGAISAEASANAMNAYKHYNGDANHPSVHQGTHYYSFRHGDTAFFVLDTRQFRSLNAAQDDTRKTMLGKRQKAEFLAWLAAVNQTATFKFVISSVPMMRLWESLDRHQTSDTWSSFVTERSELLDVMQHVPNLVVLSGDRHEFAAATLRQTVTEFSTSPLNQFYSPLSTLSESTDDGEDVAIRYESRGSSKFSTFTVDTRVRNEPRVHVKYEITDESEQFIAVIGRAAGVWQHVKESEVVLVDPCIPKIFLKMDL